MDRQLRLPGHSHGTTLGHLVTVQFNLTAEDDSVKSPVLTRGIPSLGVLQVADGNPRVLLDRNRCIIAGDRPEIPPELIRFKVSVLVVGIDPGSVRFDPIRDSEVPAR